MKKVLLLICALALVAITLPAFAQMGQGSDKQGRSMGMHDGEKDQRMIFNPERLKKKLDLSDAQVAKIEEINKKYFAEHKSIGEKMKPKKEDIRKLLKEDIIDVSKIRSLMAEVSTLQTERRMLMIQQYIEFESILTPEQKVKARKAKAQMIDHGFGDRRPMQN